MSGESRGVFICPECDGISEPQGAGKAVCNDCGATFSVPESDEDKRKQAVVSRMAVRSGSGSVVERNVVARRKKQEMNFARTDEQSRPQAPKTSPLEEKLNLGKRRKKTRKRSKPWRQYLLMGSVWLAALVLVLGTVTFLKRRLRLGSAATFGVEEKLTGQARDFYLAESKDVRELLNSFLLARTPEEKAQYVRKTSKVPGVMGRFYQAEAQRVVSGRLEEEPIVWNVVYQLNPSFLEVYWRDQKGEGFEGVFVKEAGGWKLDWEHFTRYSDTPWTFFRQQFGSQKEGEFRLYLKEVSYGETSESDNIRVQLLPPVDDREKIAQETFGPIVIARNSGLGIQVLNVLNGLEGEVQDGLPKLASRDPEGYARIRAQLRWVKDQVTGEEKLKLVNILANHWRGEGLDSQSRELEDNSIGSDEIQQEE